MSYRDWQEIADWTVVERSDLLPFDGMVYDRANRVVIVGEVSHLSYRLQMLHLDDELRQRVAQIIDSYRQWVGVDKPVGSD